MNVCKTVTMVLDHTPALAMLASHIIKMDLIAMVLLQLVYNVKNNCVATNDCLISDINECTEGLGDCTHLCHNTVGSYYCTCFGPGYRLQDDNATCLSKFNFDHMSALLIYLPHKFSIHTM